ncbi:hypothetical protein GOV09_04275 [Candidatus Woesearchaeota archaeon]|nr:hypothetical protein [Candidatus Woesearchaeota archaeon]
MDSGSQLLVRVHNLELGGTPNHERDCDILEETLRGADGKNALAQLALARLAMLTQKEYGRNNIDQLLGAIGAAVSGDLPSGYRNDALILEGKAFFLAAGSYRPNNLLDAYDAIDDAVAAFEQVSQKSPGTQFLFGTALYDLGQFMLWQSEDAKQSFQRAYEVLEEARTASTRPKDLARIHHLLACVIMSSQLVGLEGDLGLANNYATDAVYSTATGPRLITLADTLRLQEDKKQAKRLYSEALSAISENSPYRRLCQRVRVLLGSKEVGFRYTVDEGSLRRDYDTLSEKDGQVEFIEKNFVPT